MNERTTPSWLRSRYSRQFSRDTIVAPTRRDRMGQPGDRAPQRLPGLGEAPFVKHGNIIIASALKPYLQKLETYAASIGARISWTSGLRSPQQQAELRRRWQAGDPSVPFEPAPYSLSKHANGLAADGETSPASAAQALGAYARSLGMGWNPVEPWHFEL